MPDALKPKPRAKRPFMGIKPPSKLKLARITLGLSQRQVADAGAAPSETVLGFWEQGKSPIPPMYRPLLAQLYGCNEAWIEVNSRAYRLPEETRAIRTYGPRGKYRKKRRKKRLKIPKPKRDYE
jgi:transcriptional regulator with XRE-family HTH domain